MMRVWCVASVAAIVLAACGGSGVTGSAVPQAILGASFAQGADNTCSIAGQSIAVGVFPDGGTANPTPVKSGSGSAIGTIGVTCTVKSAGINTYLVDGTITAGANTIFVIHGDMTTSAPDGGIPAINATLANNAAPNVTYAQNDGGCRVTYTGIEGVIGGRVWGLVTCPAAALQGGTGTCATTAEFRFENCVSE